MSGRGRGKGDEGADYKSTFTTGDGASVAPSEYSGQADYKSMYATDDDASVFSALTGAETTTVVSRRSRRKNKKEETTDGAETAVPSEYFRDDKATDYQSMFVDDNATAFTGLSGMDGHETVYTRNETTTEVSTALTGITGTEVSTAFTGITGTEVSTAFTGITGTEVSTAYTENDGESAFTERKRKRKRRRKSSTNIDEKDKPDEAKATSHPPIPIPIICKTDVDASILGDEGNHPQPEAKEGDKAESVHGSPYAENAQGGGEQLVYSEAPESDHGSTTDGNLLDPYYSVAGDGQDIGSIYGGADDVDVQGASFPNYVVAFLESDSWITYIFGFLTFMLLCCAGSVAYMIVVIPISDTGVGFAEMVLDMELQFEELQQSFFSTLRETSILSNRTLSTLQSINETEQENIDTLQPLVQESNYLVSNLSSIGRTPRTAVRSCASLPPSYEPGFYYISSRTGRPIRVYCDNSFECKGLTGGWMRVIHLDTANESHVCPPGSVPREIEGTRRCVSAAGSAGCSTLMFGGIGISYSHVCGRIIGYQLGQPSAFRQESGTSNIDSTYVDGISITQGQNPRQHIWTFAVAMDEDSASNGHVCPCTLGGSGTPAPPSFVGNNYFCETGVPQRARPTILYSDDALWDGRDCRRSSTCCTFNDPPWFYTRMPEPVVDDLEVRVCRNKVRKRFDIFIAEIEMYIRQ